MVVIEHIFIFGAYALIKRFVKMQSAIFVIASAAVVGFSRTVLTTSSAILLGTDSGVAWQYQLLLGSLYEVAMVLFWANLNGAYRDHSAIVKTLNQTRDAILGYRENAEVILAEEQEKLLELTRSTLLPQIERIEAAITAGNIALAARWGVAQELKGLINNQVRPLSESLRSSARALLTPPKSTPGHFVSVISIPKRFYLKNSIFPAYTFGAMFLAHLANPFWLLDVSWVIPSLFLSLTYIGVLLGIKRLLKNAPLVNAWIGIPSLVLVAIVPVLPTYLVTLGFYPDSSKAAIFGASLSFVSLIVIGILALLDSFDFEARNYRELLKHQNDELTHEVALFEQQLWAARKNWSLVIHGTVQASLTAALTRLNATDADNKTLALAKKDLDRAVASLSATPSLQLKFNDAVKQIVATWQGVCEIELVVPAPVKKIAAKDLRLSMCINEILKEAISNAVRHGDARCAQVSMSLIEDQVIDLVVTNDGQAPRQGSRKGVGSSLLDELTVSWSLSFDETAQKTKLHARLPFSKSQA
jgi:signal transduction histidine kinase